MATESNTMIDLNDSNFDFENIDVKEEQWKNGPVYNFIDKRTGANPMFRAGKVENGKFVSYLRCPMSMPIKPPTDAGEKRRRGGDAYNIRFSVSEDECARHFVSALNDRVKYLMMNKCGGMFQNRLLTEADFAENSNLFFDPRKMTLRVKMDENTIYFLQRASKEREGVYETDTTSGTVNHLCGNCETNLLFKLTRAWNMNPKFGATLMCVCARVLDPVDITDEKYSNRHTLQRSAAVNECTFALDNAQIVCAESPEAAFHATRQYKYCSWKDFDPEQHVAFSDVLFNTKGMPQVFINTTPSAPYFRVLAQLGSSLSDASYSRFGITENQNDEVRKKYTIEFELREDMHAFLKAVETRIMNEMKSKRDVYFPLSSKRKKSISDELIMETSISPIRENGDTGYSLKTNVQLDSTEINVVTHVETVDGKRRVHVRPGTIEDCGFKSRLIPVIHLSQCFFADKFW